jgi:hypothetical protein
LAGAAFFQGFPAAGYTGNRGPLTDPAILAVDLANPLSRMAA